MFFFKLILLIEIQSIKYFFKNLNCQNLSCLNLNCQLTIFYDHVVLTKIYLYSQYRLLELENNESLLKHGWSLVFEKFIPDF